MFLCFLIYEFNCDHILIGLSKSKVKGLMLCITIGLYCSDSMNSYDYISNKDER